MFFLIFCGYVTPPLGRWGFGGHHSFVERQGSGARHLVTGTLHPIVRLIVFLPLSRGLWAHMGRCVSSVVVVV